MRRTACNYMLACLALVAAGVPVRAAQAQSCPSPDRQPAILDLLKADQDDARLPPEQQTRRRNNRILRQHQVIQLARCQRLATGQEWYAAALIMVHGDSEDDFLAAMAYAKRALQKRPDLTHARKVLASAFDQLLIVRGQKQWFGTQYDLDGTLPIEPCVVTAQERQFMGVDETVIADQALANPACSVNE